MQLHFIIQTILRITEWKRLAGSLQIHAIIKTVWCEKLKEENLDKHGRR